MRRALSNNRAGLHKELGLLALLLVGCTAVTDLDVQQKLDKYDCWWGCMDGDKTGWCCEREVPQSDHYIFDCENAGERIIK